MLQIKLVALNKPYFGRVHRSFDDVAGYSVVADKCYKQQRTVNLTGTYVPFLTTR